MTFATTALYAGIVGLIFVALSLNVSLSRIAARQSLGDGDDEALALAIRRHANFAEYTPITLILIGLIDAQGAPGWALHVAGIALVGSRIGHALGFRARRPSRLRFWSMTACYLLLAALSLANLGFALF